MKTVCCLALLIVTIIGIQGCGTVVGTLGRINAPDLVYRPYIPSSVEALYLWSPNANFDGYMPLGSVYFLYPACLIDFPFTVVTDTVMLPVDIPLAIYNMNQ